MSDPVQWLCYAWGESDKPVAQVVRSREQVKQFLIDHWFGEDSEELFATMADFDAPVWEDEGDKLEWQFEIGGVSIERVFEASLKPELLPTWNGALDAAIRIVSRKCGCSFKPTGFVRDRVVMDGEYMIEKITELKMKVIT